MARVVLDQAAIAAFAADPAVLRAVGDVAEDVAVGMRATAPKRTGAAAASIHVEPAPNAADGFRVSWDRQHFYLGFAETGTRDERARPFIARAVGRLRRRG